MKSLTTKMLGFATLALAFAGAGVFAAVGVLPPERQAGNVTYVTGGVAQDQSEAFKLARSSYPLSIELVQQSGGKNEFTFLASMGTDLPAGKYDVTVQFSKPFVFRDVLVTPKELKILKITGDAQMSLAFQNPDLQTEAVNSETLERFTLKNG